MSEQKVTNPRAASSRHVRSFVRRTGRMTVAQQRAMRELWPQYGVVAESATLDVAALFGRQAPLVVEIGIGNGDNLVAMAAAMPAHNFLGIETHEPGIGHCLLRTEELGLGNVRLIKDDAVEVLKTNLPAESVSRINLFFPDPWPKKRHHKRRIVQTDFLHDVARCLQPGGMFHVATDWAEYAEHIRSTVIDSGLFESVPAPADRIATRFDARGARLGHSNHEMAWCTRSKLPLADDARYKVNAPG